MTFFLHERAKRGIIFSQPNFEVLKNVFQQLLIFHFGGLVQFGLSVLNVQEKVFTIYRREVKKLINERGSTD